MLKNIISFSKILLNTILAWNKIKKTKYALAKYAPIIFKHKISNHEFTIFQTLEMIDFVNNLDKYSINSFVKENGIFIAHTYFSVPLPYHKGRMIIDNKINSKVDNNFKYLSENIRNNKIWNPTLTELISYLDQYNLAIFDINENDEIFCSNCNNLHVRNIDL